MVPDIKQVPTTIAVIVALTLAPAVIVMGWDWLRGVHPAGMDTNPEIFPVFRTIEARCMSEDLSTARCDGALAHMANCSDAADGCTAQEYYCVLHKLGFELPPFYIDDSAHLNRRVC